MIKYCHKTNKHCHLSKGAAEAHIRNLIKTDKYKGQVAYVCLECQQWHVGREKKNTHKSKY